MKRNGTYRQDDIMTLKEVAKYLGLHVMTVYKLTREGRVPAAKIGGQWRFKRNVLDEWHSPISCGRFCFSARRNCPHFRLP
jgi:excisionase family DNA binding protein